MDMIYLDHAATTPCCQPAVQAGAWAEQNFYNPSALYAPAAAVRTRLEDARATLRGAMGLGAGPAAMAGAGGNVIFTAGGTESNALAVLGTANRRQKLAGRLITTSCEHPSVLEAFRFLQTKGAELIVLPVQADGRVDRAAFAAALSRDTLLISIQHVNNETGAIQPIDELCKQAAQAAPRALFHSDGVQAFLRVQPPKSVDLYSVSAHKIGGRKGVGALRVPANAALPGVRPGGGQEFGLRSGTEDVAGILGMAAAVEWVQQGGWQPADTLAQDTTGCPAGITAAGRYLFGLKQRFAQVLFAGLQDVAINGPALQDGAPHILNIGIRGVRGETLLHKLEAEGVLVGRGAACSAHKQSGSAVLQAMGVEEALRLGALRISFGLSNTLQQAETAAQAVCRAAKALRG